MPSCFFQPIFLFGKDKPEGIRLWRSEIESVLSKIVAGQNCAAVRLSTRRSGYILHRLPHCNYELSWHTNTYFLPKSGEAAYCLKKTDRISFIIRIKASYEENPCSLLFLKQYSICREKSFSQRTQENIFLQPSQGTLPKLPFQLHCLSSTQ